MGFLSDLINAFLDSELKKEKDKQAWKAKYYYDEFNKCYKFCPTCVHKEECRDYGKFWGK